MHSNIWQSSLGNSKGIVSARCSFLLWTFSSKWKRAAIIRWCGPKQKPSDILNNASRMAPRLCTRCWRGKMLDRNNTSTRSIPDGSSLCRRNESPKVPLDRIRTMSHWDIGDHSWKCARSSGWYGIWRAPAMCLASRILQHSSMLKWMAVGLWAP